MKWYRKFHVAGRLVLISCHWRMSNLWKWPPFWLSAKRVRRADGQSIGFTSLFLGVEFAVLKLQP